MKPEQEDPPPINWVKLIQVFVVSLMLWALFLRFMLFLAE
jgi:hypothetical protein